MDTFTRFLRALAVGLEAFQDAFREDPPAVLTSTSSSSAAPDSLLAKSRALANDMRLRRALHDALHRYSPRNEPPAQA